MTQHTRTDGKVPDLGALYTNELIDEVNHFDPTVIVEQAKAMTF